MKLLTSVLALSVILLSGTVSARVIDRIAAIVNNDIITQSELKIEMKLLPDLNVRQVLDGLIADKLLRQDIEQANIKISDDELANAVRKLLMRSGMTPAQLRAKVAKEGVSYQEYMEQLRGQLARDKFINQAIGAQLKLSDRDVRDYYERYKGSFPGSFEDEKDSVYEALYNEKLKSSVQAYLARQKRKSFIEIKNEALVNLRK